MDGARCDIIQWLWKFPWKASSCRHLVDNWTGLNVKLISTARSLVNGV